MIFASELILAIKDALKRLIIPSIENEIRKDLFEKAEDASLVVFKKKSSSTITLSSVKKTK